MMEDHAKLVSRLTKPGDEIKEELTDLDCHLLHMIVGLSGEVGELTDAIKKNIFYRKPLDLKNVIEELGDIEFYIEGLRSALNISRELTLEENIKKLSKRYNSGSYSDEEAKERADKS